MKLIQKTRHLTFVFAITLIMLVTSIAYAQETTPYIPTDDEVNAVAKQLYCPVCENIPLDVCGTQACAQWRALIRDKLSQGWDEEQIKTYFVAQYGDRVLAEPPARGLNWLVYFVPPLAFFLGIYLLYRGLQSWRRPAAEEIVSETVPPSSKVPTDEYIAQIEEELRSSDR